MKVTVFFFFQKPSPELQIHFHKDKNTCVTREEMNSPGCALGVLQDRGILERGDKGLKRVVMRLWNSCVWVLEKKDTFEKQRKQKVLENVSG